jgi:hypothetical protein
VLGRTQESWEGEEVSAQAATLREAVDASLRAWLENLKQSSEGRTVQSEMSSAYHAR